MRTRVNPPTAERPRRRGIALAAALLLASGAIAAGCGGDDEDPASAWASDVCSAITGWGNDVRASVATLQGGNLTKASLQDAAASVKESTDALGDELEGLDAPDIPSAGEAKTLLTGLSSQLSSDVASIQSAFDGVSGVSGVLTAAGAASATLKSMASSISSTVASLKSLDPQGELRTAFDSSSDCTNLEQQLREATGSG